jgi:hypothetical protein
MDDTSPAVGGLSPEWLDLFVVLGAILLVLLGLFFWALFFRKRKGERHRKRRERPESYRKRLQKGAADIKQLLNERQRRRRREHRPINPTLAQTGGLPPVREEKKSGGTTQPT